MATIKELKQFDIPTEGQIVLSIDSASIFHILKVWGSRASDTLTRMLGPILHLCQRKRWHIDPMRIASSLKVLADGLSRDTTLPS